MTPSGFPVFHDILLHFQTQHFRQVRRASFLSDSESFRNLIKNRISGGLSQTLV